MPKLIDNYVLNRKIGAGQYGEVFRGYDRATNQQIAVKSIKRENVKGKFKELLQSQIKVLKSCQNSHIIKLYDMKKTSNNFYLIMEYCNDGDLETYVKKKKYLIQDQAISIFCEIVHGFEHLYKHKILHRDLKLANILRHDGSTKIADFGFSKILKEEDLAATMLGSPLNMAPEVLQNMEYSNKADIYSLGVCFYWMLFGKPPFNAKNIVQLKDIIMKQDIAFPKNINKVSDMTQQLIKKMLKAKPQQRIGWQQLFEHPIMSYLKKQMQKQMTLTLTMQGSFSENISKLYLSQNLVIIHPAQFKKRQQGVQFTAEVLKEGKKKEFKGDILKKDIKQQEQKLKVKRQPIDKTNSDQLQQKVTEDEKVLNQMQSNTFYLLNERNSIIFILSVINQLRSKKQRKLSQEIVGHLIKQVGTLFKKLQESISEKVNNYKLPYWDQFIYSSSFKNLEHFLFKEQVIVKFELEKGSQFAKPSTESFQSLVKAYCNNMSELLKKDGYDEKNRSEWIQLNHLMDISKIDTLLNEEFDFKHYYNDYGKAQIKQLIDKTRQRIKSL